VTPPGLADLRDGARWPPLADALASWLPAQRWFGGKARQLSEVHVDDVVLLGDAEVLIVVLQVRYDDGGDERYQVPLVEGAPAIAEVEGLPLREASADARGRRLLAEANLTDAMHRSAAGAELLGLPVEGAPSADLEDSRTLGVEQSNTSVVFGDALILKVFRRLEPGLNPDVELTRALTETGFDHVPPQAGALQLDPGDGTAPTYLGVLSAFLGGAREGWDLATAEARAVLEGGTAGELAEPVRDLGHVVGQMHVRLRDAFGAEEASPDHADVWSRSMEEQARRVLDLAASRAPKLTHRVLARREDVLARFGGLAELGDLGLLVRTHGDLHLGQVLLDGDLGWQILDFEGEPARPLEERRHRQTPLRDVAGVLRSFDYAAASAALDPPPELAAWRDALRESFLDGYRKAVAPAGLLPERAWPALLAAFELDKALYELGYELANRPDWVTIPVAGILRVLEHAPAPPRRSTDLPTRS
jgi:predicted trehalose synthase